MARAGNGTSDKIVSDPLPLPATYTIALWYKNAATPGSSVIDQPFSWSSSTSNHGVVFSWDHTSATFSQAWAHYDGAWRAAKYTTPLQANTWYHLASTYNGTNILAYLNGTLEVTTAAGAPSDAGVELVSLLAGTGGTDVFDDGIVAELVIWYNTVLTAEEIVALAKGVSPMRVRPGAYLYWPVWGVASPEPDLSGNARHGTVTGTILADHAPVGRHGIVFRELAGPLRDPGYHMPVIIND